MFPGEAIEPPFTNIEFPFSISISIPSNPYVFIKAVIELTNAFLFAVVVRSIVALAPPTLKSIFLP